ncbi:MAG: type II toxin-antitoxin system HicB family antitoxin [Ruminococcus sp.]|nr:type II toxin-antitoxin system HicB family antitoxin [Ruminococcus sp.]
MAKYVYPAVFTKEENNAYSVDFPDVENCYTCGNSLVNAMEMASDVLAMMLCFREKEKKPIPVATPIKEIQTNADSFATLILCDTTDYPLVECEPNAE